MSNRNEYIGLADVRGNLVSVIDFGHQTASVSNGPVLWSDITIAKEAVREAIEKSHEKSGEIAVGHRFVRVLINVEPIESVLKTYREWNAMGRLIHRGSKACGFQGTDPLFSESQTYDPNIQRQTQHQFSSRFGSNVPWRDDPPH